MSRSSGNAALWAILLGVGLLLFALLYLLPFGSRITPPIPSPTPSPDPTTEGFSYSKLASCDALAQTLATARDSGVNTFFGRDVALDAVGAPQAVSESAGIGGGAAGQDYTSTNVQVAGVDEADIVKTDGSFVYTLTGGRVHIVSVENPENPNIVSTITPGGEWASEIYVFEDTLVVFTSRYVEFEQQNEVPQPAPDESEAIAEPPAIGIAASEVARFAPGYGSQLVGVELYDISDRSSPERIRAVEFEGNLLTSRLIDGDVVVVVQSWPRWQWFGEGAPVPTEPAVLIPQFRSSTDAELMPIVECGDVAVITPIVENNFLTVARFPANEADGAIAKNVVLGAGSNVYASKDSLYVAGTDHNYGIPTPMPFEDVPVLGDVIAPREEPQERTRLHAFSLGGDIDYRGSALVPGSVLNQFSMDEYEGVFRIATTEHRWGSRRGAFGPVNALYTLNAESLERLGGVENIAPGEVIYSARFMGERAYIVTFRTIDPFFVIDLTNPSNPTILGELKIPGFSDYLHPFNASGTMIIGVGKNAQASTTGEFAWFQGLKLALFDATDPTNPTELFTTSIGDRGTDSPALHNHKAFLFDSTRNLLILPVTLAELSEEVKSGPRSESAYGETTYQGAYVYALTTENGFELVGRVTHLENLDAFFAQSGLSAGLHSLYVQRALRIGDTLVTLSDGKLLLSNLADDLEILGSVLLPGNVRGGGPIVF